MLDTKGKCPYCGLEIPNYPTEYVEKDWKYGSPIRGCEKCGKEYVDRRYHEIAVEGVAPDAFSVKQSAMCMLVAVITFAISVAIVFVQIETSGTYSARMSALAAVGAIVAILMLFNIISIKTGIKERRFEKLRSESEERLRNKGYAQKLASVGYDIPEKYL